MEKLYSDSFLRDLDRPALQALCKKHGLKAMGKREALVRLLSRQPTPGHESIMKEMSKRKAVVPANPEKKPVTASRRSPRKSGTQSSLSADSAPENKPAVDMKDVLLAVEQNGDDNPIVHIRSTDASAPRVKQEPAVAIAVAGPGPQRTHRVSNRVNPIARPKATASRRAASVTPALPIFAELPSAVTTQVEQASIPQAEEQKQAGEVPENPIEVTEFKGEPAQDTPQQCPSPAQEPCSVTESQPLVRRNFPELEFPSIVGFHARQELRLQSSLSRSQDPTRAQTPEPEERPGPGTTTPPGPASPTNFFSDEPSPEWLDFERMIAEVIEPAAAAPVIQEPEAPSFISRSGRKCRPNRIRTPSARARDPIQVVAALENSRGMRRMYRQLWHRVMRSHEALFKTTHPDRTFVWPPIPKELRPYPGEEPDPEDDSEFFSQVYADCIKLNQLSPVIFMEAHKLLLGKVDPSELSKISDVPEVIEEPIIVLPPEVKVEGEAQAAEAEAEDGSESESEDEDAEGESEEDEDEDMEEVDCTPVVDEAELRRQVAEAKRRRAQIEALIHTPELDLPKFKRFVRHYTNKGARQPDAVRGRQRGAYLGAGVPLDLDAIAAPRRPPYYMAFNITRRGMSEADAFSLYLDAGNGRPNQPVVGDALDFYDDDDDDMEDEDEDFDEDCDEDVDEGSCAAMTVDAGLPTFEPGASQLPHVVVPSSQPPEVPFDASNVQQAFGFPGSQTTAEFAATPGTIDPNSLFVFEEFSAQDGMVQHTQTVDGAMLQQQQPVFNFDQAIFGDASQAQQQQQQYGVENSFPAQAPTPQDLLAQQQQQQEQQTFLSEQELNAFASSANWNAFSSNAWNVFDGTQAPMTPTPGESASFDDGSSFVSSPAMTFDSNSSFDASSPFECPTPFDAASFAGDTPMDVDSMITPEALQTLAAQWEDANQFGQCAPPLQHAQIQLQPEPVQYQPAYEEPWPPARPPGSAHQYDPASLAQWRHYAERYLKYARTQLPEFRLPPFEDQGARFWVEPPHRPRERSLGGWVRDIQWLMHREEDAQEKWVGGSPGPRRSSPLGHSRFHPSVAATAAPQQN
ncbi:hypothetical protein AURDEDRAFT_117511 [Auricularia subglabra TFB-10046 SS5]|nr:hypothetical protein AURDEDRAFT_117511 [Auricularia subglabra TFB-10046 SS5]